MELVALEAYSSEGHAGITGQEVTEHDGFGKSLTADSLLGAWTAFVLGRLTGSRGRLPFFLSLPLEVSMVKTLNVI